MMKKIMIVLISLIISLSACACSNEKADEPIETDMQNAEEKEIRKDEFKGEKTESENNIGEENALKSAKSYLSFMPFSHDGLINQLEYEGYTKEEATYAADNCGADWKEQALDNAKNYLETMAFSYEGLINQLEYEGYTKEEATYAADNCGADWKELAAQKTKDYIDLENASFSKEELIEQLEYEGFTHEQAVYGAEINGY